MATMMETPSRIWRRIEAVEHRDMPSLPSLPGFEDSAEEEEATGPENDDILYDDLERSSSPLQSTPTTIQHAISSYRGPGSNSSSARFAHSIASRSNKSSTGPNSSRFSSRKSQHGSFEIPSLPVILQPAETAQSSDEEDFESKSSVPEAYLPPEEDEDEEERNMLDRELSLTDALESISREGSPPFLPDISRQDTPKKNYDYSVSLKSEPKPSPLQKYRNVALRRTNPRARTPSLSRTSSSETSSPTHSTPQSNRSPALPRSQTVSPVSATAIPLPRSNSNSPAIVIHRPEEDQSVEESDVSRDTQETRSMDITDVHISPPRLEGDFDAQYQDTDEHSQKSAEEDAQETQDEREPTFSSEGNDTPQASNRVNVASMPSPSAEFTPTPALPRQRARFNLPTPPNHILSTPVSESRNAAETQETSGRDITLSTPYNRPSFLLSVINSTARPRMAAGTPHPHRFGTPSVAESTPAAATSANTSSAIKLQSAFAGITRRPRIGLAPRMSHPLAQAISAGASSDSEISSPVEGGGVPGHVPWGTPSPYDGTTDKASFISTASSHDLTTHQRANTSFDPAMGFGAGAPPGRFNAGKLNTYLHGLNRRLQEENEVLVERLKELEEERQFGGLGEGGIGINETSNRRLSGGGRRRSSLGTVLGDVKEEVGEGWLEEKVELEEMLETLQAENEKHLADMVEAQRALGEERDERERDKQRWKERMAEVQEGVSGIIVDLEKKVKAAEEDVKQIRDGSSRRIREMERSLQEVENERDMATERASKAERLLESGRDLGSAVTEANERVAHVMGDLKNANMQIRGLEDEVMQSDAHIDELEKGAKEDKEAIARLEEELASREDAVMADRARITKLEETIRLLDEELQETKGYADEMEQVAGDAGERNQKLEQQLHASEEMIDKMIASEDVASKEAKALKKDIQLLREREEQLDEALDEASANIRTNEDIISDLRNQLAHLERERQKDVTDNTRDPSRAAAEFIYTITEYEALEREVDEANKEKARLRTLLEQSPARKAIEKAKDLKIELLEREKEELMERNRALRATFNEIGTPNKLFNNSGISPIHRHVLNMSVRMPKTPGGPLRDMSWLNSTQHDPSLTPLVSEIRRLQVELDRANESIDDKLDKLEDHGLGVVGLTQKLEDARAKIVSLEDDIADLKRKDQRRLRRLAHVRCQKCNIKLDLGHVVQAEESSLDVSHLPTEPPTPPTRTSEALKANLQSVNDHLGELKKQWEAEKKKLLGEKAILEDAASRLNTQIKTTKAETKKVVEGNKAAQKAKGNVQSELEKAKQTIAVLETELASERSRLRVMITQQENMQRDKKQILTDMQRTEGDMEDVKQQMQRLKKENQALEKELRENANAEQKARLLETRVVENVNTIEQLRNERTILAADHQELQKRFSEVTESANKLRNKYASRSTAHDNRRHELDMHRLEIDDLRKALDDRANDLQRVEQEKEKISSEKQDVVRSVAALEADVKRVRRNAEAFGRDLKALRAEKEKLETKSKEEIAKAERARKQAQAQIRVLNEQLDTEKEKALRAMDQWKGHVRAVDENQVAKLKLQHNKECKGLIVQIRYLKAKFTRESVFRGDLSYQKQYLLVLLQQFEKSERNISAAIARIGFPAPPPSLRKKPLKLKSVALMAVFMLRVRKSSDGWRMESAAKKSVAEALEDVRRRRTVTVG